MWLEPLHSGTPHTPAMLFAALAQAEIHLWEVAAFTQQAEWHRYLSSGVLGENVGHEEQEEHCTRKSLDCFNPYIGFPAFEENSVWGHLIPEMLD